MHTHTHTQTHTHFVRDCPTGTQSSLDGCFYSKSVPDFAKKYNSVSIFETRILSNSKPFTIWWASESIAKESVTVCQTQHDMMRHVTTWNKLKRHGVLSSFCPEGYIVNKTHEWVILHTCKWVLSLLFISTANCWRGRLSIEKYQKCIINWCYLTLPVLLCQRPVSWPGPGRRRRCEPSLSES